MFKVNTLNQNILLYILQGQCSCIRDKFHVEMEEKEEKEDEEMKKE